MNCTVDVVKVRAYAYFKELTSGSNARTGKSLLEGQGKCDDAGGAGRPWSFEELILLDSLMLAHATDLGLDAAEADRGTKEDGGVGVGLIPRATGWEKVAARLPGARVVVPLQSAGRCRKGAISR